MVKLWLGGLGLMLWVGAVTAQPLTLVAEGRSAFSIYCAPEAPPSAQWAAGEVQRVLKAATGVELPRVATPTRPMICVGNNPSAVAAGLTTDDLPHDSFWIVSREGNLYLLGRDFPGDSIPQRGWTSRGTLNAVCDFLERLVGVRWLMPGEVGEEIPSRREIILPPLEEKHVPLLPIRYLVDIQERRPPADGSPNLGKEWLLRHKLLWTGDGRRLDHGHAWEDYVKQEQWAANPQWLSKDETGQPRDYSKHPRSVKFCTHNPELIEAFTEGLLRTIAARPPARCFSISPSDGGDFCQCPECRQLVTADPWGKPSYTRVILKFYNDIARRVGAKYPDLRLAGYVYYNYMYPPAEPVKMEPNVWLVQAPLNYYGYGLLKPVYREEFPQVIAGWLKTTPNFVYHNYSNWMRSFNGAPLPAARDILKLEVPTIYRQGGRGVDMLGLGAWGIGGPTNYIYAKQMWQPEVDVDQIYEEWLRLAYGAAYEPMRRLLDLVEQRFVDYKSAEDPTYRGHMYEMNYEKTEQIYLPIFPEMERLYREAWACELTAKQRRRLELFGDNLVQLHWGMRQAGMPLPEPEKSLFYRTAEQFARFLAETEFALHIYRNHGKRYTGPIWKGEWSG